MAKAFGIVTAASNRYVVEGMQEYRPISSFSFAGRYRLVDFPISNFSNSGIDRIQVYISGNPRSLVEHLGTGRQYNINSKRGKLQLLFHDEGNINRLYNTDIAAFMDSIDLIERTRQEYVIITSSNMVFREDFSALLDQHIKSEADISLLYHRVDNACDAFRGCSVLNLNRQKGVLGIEMNMGNAKDRNIFMDTFVMKKALFVELIKKAAKTSSMYHLSRFVSSEAETYDIRGIQHKGYFAAITDLKSYYDANLSLIDSETARSLFDGKWLIYTQTTDSCPTQYFEGASVKKSMVSNGCHIEGTIENSVIGRGVKVGKGAVIRNSVVLAYAQIGKDVVIENQVIDKWARVIHANEVISDADKPGYVRRDDTL